MKIVLRYDSHNLFIEMNDEEVARFNNLTNAVEVKTVVKKILEGFGFIVEEHYEN